jgi:hypothetical protein
MHSTGLLAYLKYGIGSPKFGFMFSDQADQDVFIEAGRTGSHNGADRRQRRVSNIEKVTSEEFWRTIKDGLNKLDWLDDSGERDWFDEEAAFGLAGWLCTIGLANLVGWKSYWG